MQSLSLYYSKMTGMAPLFIVNAMCLSTFLMLEQNSIDNVNYKQWFLCTIMVVYFR